MPKQTLTASEQDVKDTQDEAKAAQLLLKKVKAAVSIQNNITYREGKELSPLIYDLENKQKVIEENHGLHSKEAIAAVKETVKLLYQYYPDNIGESGGDIYEARTELMQYYNNKKPNTSKPKGGHGH